jgi:hypothetical protein
VRTLPPAVRASAAVVFTTLLVALLLAITSYSSVGVVPPEQPTPPPAKAKTQKRPSLPRCEYTPTPPGARRVCLFSRDGPSGAIERLTREFAPEATRQFGMIIEPCRTNNERDAIDLYIDGKCDAVFATGLSLQRFNTFSSSIEAVGAITDYDIAKHLLTGLARSATAAPLFRSGDHETAGLLPAGFDYLFVHDRSIDTVDELRDHKISYLRYDDAGPAIVRHVEGIAVPSDIANSASRFNSGAVDACILPAVDYGVFDLGRGIGTTGGVLELPVALRTHQLLIRHARFPAEFGIKARAWFATKFDSAVAAIKKEEANIPSSSWIRIPAADRPRFDDMFLQVRLSLKGKAYHPAMLKVLRMSRCKVDPARSECAEKKE